MFFIRYFKVIYILFSLILAGLIAYSTVYISRRGKKFVRNVTPCLVMSIATVAIYALFLLQYIQNFARYFYCLYLICLVIMIFELMKFSISYSSKSSQWITLENIFTVFVTFDVIYLILNALIPFSFNLAEVPFKFAQNGKDYENITVFVRVLPKFDFQYDFKDSNGNLELTENLTRTKGFIEFSFKNFLEQLSEFNYFNPFFFHGLLCIIMVSISLIFLFAKTLKAPTIYKYKYAIVLSVYIVAVIVYHVFLFLKSGIEATAILFAFLNFFIAYFSIYSSPERLEKKALYKINEELPDAIICFDTVPKLIYLNLKAREIFKSDTENQNDEKKSISKRKLMKFFLNVQNDWKNLSKQKDKNLGVRDLMVNGSTHYFNVEFHPIMSEKIQVGSFIKLTDKTEDIEKVRREEYIADHDSLTKLYNRKKFFETAESLLESEKDQNWNMICFNIKDFKLVNELFGNRKGDELLKKYAEFVQKYASRKCCYGRINDDKIALLIKEGEFPVQTFKENVIELSSLFDNLKIHINAGVYKITDVNERIEIMYDKAVMALKKDSDSYQKLFTTYDANSLEQMREEKNIMDKFEKVLMNEEVLLYLQPIVNEKGEALGCEARARWLNDGKIISSGKFINALRTSGLICKLDYYIWNLAAQTLCDWKIDGLDNFSITVSVDEKDIYYLDIVKVFKELVQKNKIEPQNLVIQFKENDFVKNYRHASTVANKLSEEGFPVCITDFGGGYSSLNVLKDMDINSIKMDVSFVDAEIENSRNTKILNTIVSLAHDLNYSVVSKGIKNQSQVEQMCEMGFKLFQGDYFSPAIDVSSFEKKYLPQIC